MYQWVRTRDRVAIHRCNSVAVHLRVEGSRRWVRYISLGLLSVLDDRPDSRGYPRAYESRPVAIRHRAHAISTEEEGMTATMTGPPPQQPSAAEVATPKRSLIF